MREDKWSTEEDIENMSMRSSFTRCLTVASDRDIRSLKKDREEQERANKEVLQTISDGIHQIIENQQTSKVLRVAAQTELQDVKRQVLFTFNSFPLTSNADSGYPNFPSPNPPKGSKWRK